MEEIGQFVSGLEHFVRGYGVAAVTVILTLEALGAPVPGETLLVFSAVLAARGEMSLPALLVCAWMGSVLGDNIGYWIGRRLGRAAVTRYGTRIGITAERFDAIAVLEQSLARDPNDRDALLALVSFNRDAGQFTTALGYAERLARLAPQDRDLANLIQDLRRRASASQ